MRNDRWITPPEIFNPLMAEFNFDLDAAADAETARVHPFLDNSLEVDRWPGERIWLNPPYGRMLDPFVRRAQQAEAGCRADSVPLSCGMVA